MLSVTVKAPVYITAYAETATVAKRYSCIQDLAKAWRCCFCGQIGQQKTGIGDRYRFESHIVSLLNRY
jgi:hypothetical protein